MVLDYFNINNGPLVDPGSLVKNRCLLRCFCRVFSLLLCIYDAVHGINEQKLGVFV